MSETLAQSAARLTQELGFSVTPRQVQLWRGKGYPMDDAAALRLRLLNQERVPKGLRLPSSPEIAPASPPPVNVDDLSPEGLDARLRELQGKLLGTTDYESARTIRTQIAALRDVFRIQTDRGIYVLAADMKAAGIASGTASRAAWEKIVSDLPPVLEGLSAMGMVPKLREYVRARCVEMSTLFEGSIQERSKPI